MSTTARSTATSSGSERSSSRSTTTSRRSKPSMASVIDIASTDPVAPDAETAPELEPEAAPRAIAAPAEREPVPRRRRFRLPRVSPLTRRIVVVNVLPLALLAIGFLYLGKFEASLIGQQIEALRTQGEIFAAALGEGAVLDSPDDGEILLPDLARQMMRRLVAPTHTPARLFDRDGKLIADSKLLAGPGDVVEVTELPPPENKSFITRLGNAAYDWIARLLPQRRAYPAYRDGRSAADFAEAERALHGESGSAVRRTADKQLVISVAVPVQRYKEVLGAVMLSSVNGDIETELRNVRFE